MKDLQLYVYWPELHTGCWYFHLGQIFQKIILPTGLGKSGMKKQNLLLGSK